MYEEHENYLPKETSGKGSFSTSLNSKVIQINLKFQFFTKSTRINKYLSIKIQYINTQTTR